ncbi:hypothetical protein BBJ28_00016684 [Nothophytophthora sp. Chile5]|nr:hypothetical protein BBJ28_00016684 [Nothophytophthora sp. Chile5]
MNAHLGRGYDQGDMLPLGSPPSCRAKSTRPRSALCVPLELPGSFADSSLVPCHTQLNHFEVKPGVIITYVLSCQSSYSLLGPATEAEFPGKKLAASKAVGGRSDAQVPGQVFEGSDAIGTDDKQAAAQEVAAAVSPAAVTLPQIVLSDATASFDLPSCSIILKHIWDPLEPRDCSDAAFFDELEDDMRAECSKHGSVDRVQIVADGAVVVRFTALNAAIACLQVMNGRWFAGRQIEARFDQATAEDPSDEDAKVEAFLASVGG